jgi:alpha-glucuronidase
MENVDTCPKEFLLWFHHVNWDHKLSSGNTLWEELCRQYHQGAKKAAFFKEKWKGIKPYIDEERFNHIAMHLSIQEREAKWWRDACLTYFQTFSKTEIPGDLEQPLHDHEYYKELDFPYAPGIRPRW